MKDLSNILSKIDSITATPAASRLGTTMKREDLVSSFVHEFTAVSKTIERRVVSGIRAGVNIYIWGPTGSGKSLIAREKLHEERGEFFRVNCSSGMIIEDLVAAMVSFTDANGNVAYEPRLGPLALAQEWGIPVIIEEIDSLQDEQQHALFQWLETSKEKSVTLQGVALHWTRHPNFCCVATGNTNGCGDTTGMYSGTRPLNAALMNRFPKVIEVGYLEKADEMQLVIGAVPGLPQIAYSGVLEVSTLTRNEAGASSLGIGGVRPISTRMAVEWLKAIKSESKDPCGLSYMETARDVLIDRAEKEVHKALETIVINHFGAGAIHPIDFSQPLIQPKISIKKK